MGFRGHDFAFASPADAVRAVGARVSPVGSERCTLAEALGRVLAENILSDRDSPPFDHSAMDGFAVRQADLTHATLPIAGECRIGQAPPSLPPTPAAIRIVTGAAIPPNADLVIKREDVDEQSHDRAIGIAPSAALAAKPGDHIRRRAENAPAGATLLRAGSPLDASALSALAVVGAVQPSVFARVRVTLLTTGDEVVDPASVPSPWQIRNSNAPAIAAILRSRAWIHHLAHTHIHDDATALNTAFADALANSHAVILTGGVSMGHRDHVRDAVQRVGASILFHGLPQRPGKPMLAAITPSGQPILALPGNPLSSMITCVRIAIPALAACAGISSLPPTQRVPLRSPIVKPLNLWWHRLVRLDDDANAHLVDSQGSGDLIAAARSHGFIELPPNTSSTVDPVPFYPWPA